MNEPDASKPLSVVVVNSTADDPQRLAIAKAVNDTLNTYIAITDSKAVAFLGGAAAAASFFLSRRPEGTTYLIFYAVSAVFYAIGGVAAANVIFPRLPGPCGGVVFWGDIAGRPDAEAYRADFDRRCDDGGILADYAVLNFFTSKILRRKIRRLRLSMALCFAALATSVTLFITTRM